MKKRTKIVCKTGPSSWDSAAMRKMIENGADCIHIDSSLVDFSSMDRVKDLVRSISDAVSLMLGVKGPEIHLNKFADPIELKSGSRISIGSNPKDSLYPVNFPTLYKHVSVGQHILVGDGEVELIVKEIAGGTMHCEVISGDVLTPGKALNLPGFAYTSEVLTDQDKENLRHAIVTGWDFVSPSFTQDKLSALKIKELIAGSDMKIIAKIENETGVDHIDEILEVADGIILTREGLRGVKTDQGKVTLAQRSLIEKASNAGKPIVIATKIHESLASDSNPTRAEANEVTTSVLLGADALLLSSELLMEGNTAEAVAFLCRIALETEENMTPRLLTARALDASITADALTKAAASMCIEMAKDIDSVIVVSKTGRTARLLSRHNIAQPIYAFVSRPTFARTLLLSKGVISAFVQEPTEMTRDSAVEHILNRAKKEGIVKVNDRVLLICKTPIDGDHYFPNVFELVTIK